MTPIYLVKGMAAELREVLKDYELIAEGQADKKVSVYEMYLPTGNFEGDTFYPAVTVTLRRVEDDFKDTVAEILIVIGVFGGYDNAGWQDLLNIAERIRQFLMTRRIISDQFQLIAPPMFEPVFPDEPSPFYFGQMSVKYLVATPRGEFNETD